MPLFKETLYSILIIRVFYLFSAEIRSLFTHYQHRSTHLQHRRGSFDSNTHQTGQTGSTPRSTFSRHYKSINVRPDKRNLLAHRQRVQATQSLDPMHIQTHSNSR